MAKGRKEKGGEEPPKTISFADKVKSSDPPPDPYKVASAKQRLDEIMRQVDESSHGEGKKKDPLDMVMTGALTDATHAELDAQKAEREVKAKIIKTTMDPARLRELEELCGQQRHDVRLNDVLASMAGSYERWPSDPAEQSVFMAAARSMIMEDPWRVKAMQSKASGKGAKLRLAGQEPGPEDDKPPPRRGGSGRGAA